MDIIESTQNNTETSKNLEDKYKIFYEIVKDEYKEIHDNYYKLVDKASKYLQFLSIIVGAILFGAKWYLDTYNENARNQGWITIGIIILALSSISELILIFTVMMVKDFGKVILKLEDENYFIKNNFTQIYSGLALRYIETNIENFIHLEKKGRLLKYSQHGLIFLLILVFISIILLYLNTNYGT